RRKNHAENGEPRQYHRESPEQAVRECPGFLPRAIAHVIGEHRDERGGHRPFADQAAEYVGDAVRQDEGVSYPSSAEQLRETLVTHITENSTDHRNDADDGGRLENLLLMSRDFGQKSRPPGPAST